LVACQSNGGTGLRDVIDLSCQSVLPLKCRNSTCKTSEVSYASLHKV